MALYSPKRGDRSSREKDIHELYARRQLGPGRALASRFPNALIHDPFAEPLVRAVGVPFFTRVVSGELDPADADGGAGYGFTRLMRMMAVRTRLIDDFFVDAKAVGIRQVVILAAGLDARGLPSAMARRHDGLRGRPAAGGDQLQDSGDERDRCCPDRTAPDRRGRSPSRLGGRRAGIRFRSGAANDVERRRRPSVGWGPFAGWRSA